MLTPQDLQEVYFEKARFGGYQMQSVDEFLEKLMNDYLALYKENAVLKSKMRLLVERLEAYRGKEAEMKQALAGAQATCDEMIAKAERQCADMLANAEAGAKAKSRSAAGAVIGEQSRLDHAKAETRRFIDTVEQAMTRQQALLAELKALELEPAPAPVSAQESRKPYDFDAEADEPVVKPAPQPAPELPVTQDDIASEIEQSVEKIMENVPTPPAEMAKTKVMPAVDFGRGDKFNDLQFGKNYDPTK